MTSPDFTFRTNGPALPLTLPEGGIFPLGDALRLLHVNAGGTAAEWADVARLSAVRVYTNSGSPHTWTKPSGLRYVIAIPIGAGGSGGGTAATTGTESAVASGGGGGGTSIKLIEASALGATETVTVGAGGAAPLAGNNAGNQGGTSSFGSHCQATGGAGGQGASASSGTLNQARNGGQAGVGSGGDINLRGGDGSFSVYGGTNTYAARGDGGSSLLVGKRASDGSSSNAGYAPGGGGTGATSISSQSAKAGAVGGEGWVIVLEYT